jgi:chromosome segregation protein
MYLKRLELQGFKTFAQKTALEFVLDTSGRRGVTAVVGPNGSGKSNVADSLRWVMGEQSLKLLRGKRSEDVIFAGSEKRGRAGFCEVTMVLENDDKPDLGMSEIAVTRRLYRDGQSEYEINRQGARLGDVQLLLAQCGIGQRTYSVIGQGMVDQVLVAGPAERKEFFDEAFGLKPFQLKRNSAWNKITASREHLAQTDLLLQELGPRLASLEKQVKRLQERETIEQELRSLERQHYGRQWSEIRRGWQEAAVKMAEKVLQESNLIDIIREEDREELMAEAQAAEEAKRRR